MAIENEAYPGQNREHAQGTFADEGHPLTSQHNDRDQEDLDKDFVNRTNANLERVKDIFVGSNTPAKGKTILNDGDPELPEEVDLTGDDLDDEDMELGAAHESLPETGFDTPNDPDDDPTPGFGI